ncbi:MAG: hypothetical protein J7K89_04750 [Candidatus Cloacimonetes bacterium]|nr:hypothetical protein [Candidatus Cloacimonadota bacterium]
MKRFIIPLIMLWATLLFAAHYEIHLSWDEFEGECNGFVSGSIGKDFGFLNGVSSGTALDGKLVSLGEGMSSQAMQVFQISADEGYFTLWIKDKFADQDMNADPGLIARSKPVVTVFKNGHIMQTIPIPAGQGLACKVLTLDADEGEIDTEIKYYPKSRLIVGRVVSALTGEPLDGAQVVKIDNIQSQKTFVTDETGIFLFDADLGEHTISCGKEGFIGMTVKTRMGLDETPREVICALSPEIKEFRIVVTWGSRPADLDAHLTGPFPEGGQFHIWYRHKVLIGGRDFLDRDDTSGYGPETITIYKPAVGNYSYSVFDYSNRSKKRSKKLSRSGATVYVYGKNKLLASFEIPTNQKGNCWHVFHIDENHEIIPENRVDFISNEQSIQ